MPQDSNDQNAQHFDQAKSEAFADQMLNLLNALYGLVATF